MKQTNADNLTHAFDYLRQVIEARLAIHFNKNKSGEDVQLPALAFYEDGSVFSKFIRDREPLFEEYILLLLALAPHVHPGFLDSVIKSALKDSTDFPEIGGTRDNEKRLFLPTGETALFILADGDLDQRFAVQRLFTGDHWFARENILKLESAKTGEPHWSGRLLLNPDYVELFTLGQVSSPNFSAAFPAQQIQTEMDWEDLVLENEVLEQIEEIKAWVQHNQTLMDAWGLYRKIKPGYRALFHGPPGTGKTLAATLLGKYTDRPVFRVDLSTVVSKYIGETEKNLSNLFEKARGRDWILFFDEADALFGKRTNIKSSHDRFANQEISYLLQRVEDFEGLVILASNFKANMDDAFLRRFTAIIQFPFPGEQERARLWGNAVPEGVTFQDGQNFPSRLSAFELAGGSIVNVVQYACLKAVARGEDREVRMKDVLQGIKREVEKEGKVFKNLLE